MSSKLNTCWRYAKGCGVLAALFCLCGNVVTAETPPSRTTSGTCTAGACADCPHVFSAQPTAAVSVKTFLSQEKNCTTDCCKASSSQTANFSSNCSSGACKTASCKTGACKTAANSSAACEETAGCAGGRETSTIGRALLEVLDGPAVATYPPPFFSSETSGALMFGGECSDGCDFRSAGSWWMAEDGPTLGVPTLGVPTLGVPLNLDEGPNFRRIGTIRTPAGVTEVGVPMDAAEPAARVIEIMEQVGESVIDGTMFGSGTSDASTCKNVQAVRVATIREAADQAGGEWEVIPAPRQASAVTAVRRSADEGRIQTLRATSERLDQIAHELECAEMYEWADTLREMADGVRVEARSIRASVAAVEPVRALDSACRCGSKTTVTKTITTTTAATPSSACASQKREATCACTAARTACACKSGTAATDCACKTAGTSCCCPSDATAIKVTADACQGCCEATGKCGGAKANQERSAQGASEAVRK